MGKKQNKPTTKIIMKRIKQLHETSINMTKLNIPAKTYHAMKAISMKTKVKIPSQIKKQYCNKCGTLLKPSLSKIRIKKNRLIKHCPTCKKVIRTPLK